VPEIYPYAAKSGRAHHRHRTRRLPNQVNNSLGFPGILKGRSSCARARSRTRCHFSRVLVANFAREGNPPDYIMPTMDETEVFAQEAADVAMTAIKNGVARGSSTRHGLQEDARGHPRGARRHRRPDEERFHQGAGRRDAGSRVQKAVDAVKK